MFLLHQQKCSKPSSAHAVVISLAHLSDVDVLVQLPCSLFCKCGGSGQCFNRMTKEKDAVDDEELSGDENAGGEEDN